MTGLKERKLALAADLIWSLEEMRAKEAGKRFLMNVAQFLPVYSPALQQIYGSYSTHFTKSAVVILPSTEDFTNTYSHIPEFSIKNTSILIHPSDYGIHANVRMKNATSLSMPLSKAFKLIRTQLRGPFLPVIQRGDLRDYNQLEPCLHLNAFVPARAENLPRFVRMDISRTMEERIQELQYTAHLLGL